MSRLQTHTFARYEEKETDVAVATKLLELLARDVCDTVVVISGDTDVLPAMRTALALNPGKRVGVAFAFLRYNSAFAQVASQTIKMSLKAYTTHQFPDTIALPDGSATVPRLRSPQLGRPEAGTARAMARRSPAS